MATENNDNGIGLKKVYQSIQKIKKALSRIAVIEHTLENSTVVISKQESFSNFEQLEIVTKAEISTYSKSMRSIIIFKWALIIFESFGAYLAFGLIMHALNLESLVQDVVIVVIRSVISIGFSYAIVNFALKTISSIGESDTKKNGFTLAFFSILSLPLFNIVMIYGIQLEIDNKEIYMISLFFTLLTGTLLLLRSKSITKEEHERIEILKRYNSMLKERKKLFNQSRNHHQDIFDYNNQYNGFIENKDAISKDNLLYSNVKVFLSECLDFDQWTLDFIMEAKLKLKR